MSETRTLQSLMSVFPHSGRVEWIGLRPGRREPVVCVQSVRATTGQGLLGDHYSGRSGKRQVTLIQSEHLVAVAAMAGADSIHAEQLRRNVLVGGLNLLALRGRRFRLGSAVLEYTGLCHPCSFMEETLGPGGYNAMRGHGGITAKVLSDGDFKVGSAVEALAD
jgi:MOSC domain-containing protein YiiM